MKTIIAIIFIATLCSCINPNNKGGVVNKGNYQTKLSQNVIDTLHLAKTATILDEDLYWQIIDRSLKNTNDQDGQEKYLTKEIEALTPTEIVGFRLRTDKLLYDTYNSAMWCAGYIMNGGCSDDGFEYFRNWVISRGKQTYYKAKENPDSLISEASHEVGYYEFESFWYVALNAFKHNTGKNLYDFIDNDKFTAREGNYPKFKFTWQEDNPESMKKICPQLFDKLWGK
jgi:hypothetical protein